MSRVPVIGHWLDQMPWDKIPVEFLGSLPWLYICAIFAACVVGKVALSKLQGMTCYVGKDEQLRVQRFGDMVTMNGPGVFYLLPFVHGMGQVAKAEMLGAMDWLRVKDQLNGAERIESGPQLLFLGPYDRVEKRGQAMTLGPMDYVRVENKLTGKKFILKGPRLWVPEKQEEGRKGEGVCLGPTEFVRVTDKESGAKFVVRGPTVWFPQPHEEGAKGKAQTLGPADYVLVHDLETGERRIERGPCVWFPKPQEQLAQRSEALVLSDTEFVHVEDGLTGMVRMLKGPCVWFPTAWEKPSEVQGAVALQSGQYVKLKCMESGRSWVVRGRELVFLEPTWRIQITGAPQLPGQVEGVRNAWVLKSYEYVRLVDSVTGRVIVHQGPDVVFPGPEEDLADGRILQAIDLKVNQYVKIQDQATGGIRVVPGPAQVFLGPYEFEIEGKQDAYNVDEKQAVLLRDKETGQQRLVTEKKLFVPGPNDQIERVQQKITLAEHEAIIIKDKDGIFQYHYGKDKGKHCFYLEPHCEIVELCWSRGPRRDKRDLKINRFDCRGQYMTFEFNVRTKDNVELVVEGALFWQFEDIPLMVKTTGDTTGDICNHTRSQFIKHCARTTLKEFMDDLTSISSKVYEEDQDFYAARGIRVHSLEVTGYACAEASTAQVLQQIIKETTNRMNRLSKQESENEVQLFQMQGQIEQRRMMGDLLDIQHQHEQDSAKVEGASEAERVAAFIGALAPDVPDLASRTKIWQGIRKSEALSVLSKSKCKLVYTPQDVQLSIEN